MLFSRNEEEKSGPNIFFDFRVQFQCERRTVVAASCPPLIPFCHSNLGFLFCTHDQPRVVVEMHHCGKGMRLHALTLSCHFRRQEIFLGKYVSRLFKCKNCNLRELVRFSQSKSYLQAKLSIIYSKLDAKHLNTTVIQEGVLVTK